MIERNIQFENEIKKIVIEHGTQYPKILKRKENKYLLDYINEYVEIMKDEKYTLKQKIHFIVTGLSEFPRCKNKKCNRVLDEPIFFRGLHMGYREHCCMSCSTSDPNVVKKNKKTTKDRHGDENYRNIEQQKSTFVEYYGVDNNMKSKDGYEEYRKAINNLYGVDNQFQREEVKELSKRRRLELYGDENYNNTDKALETRSNWSDFERKAIRIKTENTCFNIYGVSHPMKNGDISIKAVNNRKYYKYTIDSYKFDSIPEFCYYVYCRDKGIKLECHPNNRRLEYIDCFGVNHYYYPDFYNVAENVLVEIKGNLFFEDRDPSHSMINVYDRNKDYIAYAKWMCMQENNVKIISGDVYCEFVDYVKAVYGNGFIEKHRTER